MVAKRTIFLTKKRQNSTSWGGQGGNWSGEGGNWGEAGKIGVGRVRFEFE